MSGMPLRWVRLFACLTGAAVLSAGCSGVGATTKDRPSVVAAFYPLAFAASQVGGDLVQVTNITKPGVEPHDLELPPSGVAGLTKADLSDQLAERGLPKTGNVDDLIDRLVEADNNN